MFPKCKSVNRILSKKQRKSFKKKHLKGTKIFLKKKNKKCQYEVIDRRYRSLSEEEKEKSIIIISVLGWSME